MTTIKSAETMHDEIIAPAIEKAETVIADSQLAIYTAMDKGELSVLTTHNVDFDSVLEINEFDRLVTVKFRELGFNAIVIHNGDETISIAVTWVEH